MRTRRILRGRNVCPALSPGVEALERRRLLAVGDTIATARPVVVTHATDTEINGEALGDEATGDLDADFFAIALTKGQRVVADIDANTLDDGTTISSLDSVLSLFSAGGQLLIQGHEAADPDTTVISGEDAVLSYVATADGTYYLAVHGAPNFTIDPNVAGSGTLPASTGAYRLQLVLNHAVTVPPTSRTARVGEHVRIDPLNGLVDPDGDPLRLVNVKSFGGGTATVNDNGTPADLTDDFIDYIAGTKSFLLTDGVNFDVDDGHELVTSRVEFQLTGAALVPGPFFGDGTSVAVAGTAGDDVIRIVAAKHGRRHRHHCKGDDGDAGRLEVFLNGKSQGTFSPTARVVAQGLAGDDKISLGRGVKLPAFFAGGTGDDRIGGGPNDDILLGGDFGEFFTSVPGEDHISGGAGRDLLAGGGSADWLDGGPDDDLLFAGDIDYDYLVLDDLMREWTRTDADYATRTTHLLDGGGLNQFHVIADLDPRDDGVADRLRGGGGQDFFTGVLDGPTADRFIRRRADEIVYEERVA